MSEAVQFAVDCHLANQKSRKQYLQSIIIRVKQIQKTEDYDQLIVVNTIRKETNIAVSIIVRKLSQLDSLIEHITNRYGGHIIPIINSDLYFQKDIEMSTLTPIIQQFLNDLKMHPYIQQDEKFYQFLFFQQSQLKKIQTFQKVLEDVSILSKKYLNAIFTRRQFNVNVPILRQLSSTYKQILIFENNFNQLKSISMIYFAQHENFQDVFTNLSSMSNLLAKSLPPNEQLTIKVQKRIRKLQKFLEQIHKAYNRIEILNETVRELKGDISKGHHDKGYKFETNEITLQKWAKSLNRQLREFLLEGQKACKFIAGQVYEMKKTQIMFCYQSSEKKFPKYSEYSIQNNQKAKLNDFKSQEEDINNYQKR